MEVQQFKGESKNVPTDTSLVCSSTSLKLNREGTLSVLDGPERGKLTLNFPEVNPAQQTGRSLKAFVFALSSKGEVLKLRPEGRVLCGKVK